MSGDEQTFCPLFCEFLVTNKDIVMGVLNSSQDASQDDAPLSAEQPAQAKKDAKRLLVHVFQLPICPEAALVAFDEFLDLGLFGHETIC